MKYCLSLLLVVTALLGSSQALIQPTSVPGDFTVTQLSFLDIDTLLAMPDPDMPVYGLYTDNASLRMYISQINSVGWKSLRLHGEVSDVDMLTITQNDLEILATLQNGKRDEFASDQAFIDAEIAHYEEQVRRYGPGGTFFTERPTWPVVPVKHWEIRNEPNFHYLYEAGTDAQKQALYAQLLPAAYTAIKAVNPQCTVVGFGTGGGGGADKKFMEKVHEANAAVASSYDILSTHPYSNNVGYDVLNNRRAFSYSHATLLSGIRELMDTHNSVSKRVWYTEVGWRVKKNEGGTYETHVDDLTQQLQAAHVTRLYALAMRQGVERVFNMYITDADGFNGGFFNIQDHSFRKSATATKAMISILPKARVSSVISDGGHTEGYYAYVFNPNVNVDFTIPVTMAWKVEGRDTVDLPVEDGKTYEIIDMLGEITEQTAAGTQMSVAIGPCPVYVREKSAVSVADPGAGSKLKNHTVTRVSAGDVVFSLGTAHPVPGELQIYRGDGARIHSDARPVDGAFHWNNISGPGVYFYRLSSGNNAAYGKLILVD